MIWCIYTDKIFPLEILENLASPICAILSFTELGLTGGGTFTLVSDFKGETS